MHACHVSSPGDAASAAASNPQPATDGLPETGVGGLIGALMALREALASVRYPLARPNAEEATHAAEAIVNQLDDYLLPRLGRLDAPLLVVIGGSTGAGKSTLVNSLVRAPVSPAGVRRPTTRVPVLVAHPNDVLWFTQANLLPRLGRITTSGAVGGTLRVVPVPALTPGLALLDATDIDSVIDANRVLADQLLAAADLWLFVTTAARYADAVPWELLLVARSRATAVALVLDRVPAGAAEQIGPHLAEMLRARELGDIPIFVLAEAELDRRGLLNERTVASLSDWLMSLALSAAARASVIRQTVDGAIAALNPSVERLSAAADEQATAARTLSAGVHTAYRAAATAVEAGVRDGVLLRGEVLARWQDLVGTGELMRSIEARVGWLRDRIAGALTGRPPAGDTVKSALESGLVTLVRAAAADASEEAAQAWRLDPAGAALLTPTLAAPSAELTERIERMVRNWQRSVLELVRTQAGNKRFTARASAYAVNALGLVVMIAVFTATSFIPTGAEIVVAGGTTIAAQKLLEAIFGDQAIRELADEARRDLLERVGALLDAEANRYRAVLDGAGADPGAADRLRRAAAAVRSAHLAAPVPGNGAVPRPRWGWRSLLSRREP
jgi:hypothetical protein